MNLFCLDKPRGILEKQSISQLLFPYQGVGAGTSGDDIWDRTLIGTVSEKAIFCFDSMMLVAITYGIIIMANYILNEGAA